MPLAKGERHGQHKLTEAQVRWIKYHPAALRYSVRRLATMFGDGVSSGTIQAIRSGKSWAHVGPYEE